MKQYIKLPKISNQTIRQKYYTSESVRHPAKANIPMMIWILKKFCKDKDIVLDPMAGIFTTGIEGMRLFPHSLFIGIELEDKFVKMTQANIKKVEEIAKKDMFMKIGKAICVQGEARELEKVFKGKIDKIISSPPYSESIRTKTDADKRLNRLERAGYLKKKDWQRPGNIKTLGRNAMFSENLYSKNEDNIGNLKHGNIDKIISSPPYGEGLGHAHGTKVNSKLSIMAKQKGMNIGEYPDQTEENIGNLPHGKIDKIISSPPYSNVINQVKAGHQDLESQHEAVKARARAIATEAEKTNPGTNYHTPGRLRAIETMISGYSIDEDNIGNLKEHGNIDKIISSPSFGQAQSGGGIAKKGYDGPKHTPTDLIGKRSYMPENTGDNKNNIDKLPYVDKVISSPPYEGTLEKGKAGFEGLRKMGSPKTKKEILEHRKMQFSQAPYSNNSHNIGNIKGKTYLEAMFLVYRQCFAVLKNNGLMILITKDFIRNKRRVHLTDDTIKLCELAGLKYIHTYYRKIEHPSFWRILYQQKHPDVEKIDSEDIVVFEKRVY